MIPDQDKAAVQLFKVGSDRFGRTDNQGSKRKKLIEPGKGQLQSQAFSGQRSTSTAQPVDCLDQPLVA
jgi:hypothetical protein